MKALTNPINADRRQSGFTIIETMIVLAVAGLIMLLVFLAIPALQRTGSNSQREANATSILQLMSEYMLNNSGDIPQSCGPHISLGNLCSNQTDLGALSNIATVYSNSDINFYNESDDSVAPNITASAIPTADATTWISLYNYEICQTPGSSIIATPVGASYNSIVAIYNIQTGGNLQIACQQLGSN